jgi:hypothetical protein
MTHGGIISVSCEVKDSEYAPTPVLLRKEGTFCCCSCRSDKSGTFSGLECCRDEFFGRVPGDGLLIDSRGLFREMQEKAYGWLVCVLLADESLFMVGTFLLVLLTGLFRRGQDLSTGGDPAAFSRASSLSRSLVEDTEAGGGSMFAKIVGLCSLGGHAGLDTSTMCSRRL